MIIERARLTLGERVGKGGQGDVYSLATTPPELEWAGPTVVKIYQAPLSSAALDAFDRRTQWALELSRKAREELYTAACWPLAAVADEGVLVGIVMSDERPRHEAQMTLPSGDVDTVLMRLEHVLADDGYLHRCFGMTCDTRVRAVIAERLASSLSVLHRHAIVASDISHSNVLVSLQEPYAVTMIDCDSMVFRGESTLKQVETPDWEIPPAWSEPANTRGADAYKLGLAIMRLFARDQTTRDYDGAEPNVPAALRSLLRGALSREITARPAAGRWQASLRDVLGTPLNSDFPGPRASPHKPARTHSPARTHKPLVAAGALATSPTGQTTIVPPPAPAPAPVAAVASPRTTGPQARRTAPPLTSPPAIPSRRPWRTIATIAVVVIIAVIAATSHGSHPSDAAGASRPPTAAATPASKAPASAPETASEVARSRKRRHEDRAGSGAAGAAATTTAAKPADARSARPAATSAGAPRQTGPAGSPSRGGTSAGATGGGARPQSSGGGLQGSSEASSPPPSGGSGGLEGASGGSGGSGGGAGGLAGSSE